MISNIFAYSAPRRSTVELRPLGYNRNHIHCRIIPTNIRAKALNANRAAICLHILDVKIGRLAELGLTAELVGQARRNTTADLEDALVEGRGQPVHSVEQDGVAAREVVPENWQSAAAGSAPHRS